MSILNKEKVNSNCALKHVKLEALMFFFLPFALCVEKHQRAFKAIFNSKWKLNDFLRIFLIQIRHFHFIDVLCYLKKIILKASLFFSPK